MLYAINTKTKLKGKDGFKYHYFIVEAESEKEIRTKFKASMASHTVLLIECKQSKIIELGVII